jgi:protein-S-isoprenylcysteine O-methyltransferase Ste14
MKTRIKINGFIMFCVFLLIVISPGTFFRNENNAAFNAITEVFGISFILLGQILRVSARGFKAENSGNGSALIQGGPYTLVRNPMYLGILLIGFGVVLVLFQWWVIGVFVLVFIIRYLTLIFKEEKKLATAFSQEYADYKKRVPRIFPSMAALFQKDISMYLPLKLVWLKKEIGTILAVLLITLFLGAWKDIRNEGIRLYLNQAIAMLMIIILFMCLIAYLNKQALDKRSYGSNKN